jgi:predicted phage baseplate assembly protein
VQSTLQVFVNDVRWHETTDVFDLTPRDHAYTTAADHQEQTHVVFGDGRHGARLPAGVENVRAVYRSGIGKSGNVRAGQLSLLVTHTDGLRSVTNPVRASGGADPDGVETTRGRAPLAVTALDRLVSVRDYADFALTFAGIAKASATLLPARAGRLVFVTVAGEDDAPIDPGSELAVALLEALRRFGDPSLPVQLGERELLALVVAARVRLDADHEWESARTTLTAALAARFGFDRRALAQDVYAAEALAALQGVPGVDYVDLDVFAAVPEDVATDPAALAAQLAGGTALRRRVAARPARPGGAGGAPAPAQLAILLDGVPATVLLSEVSA